MDALVFQDTKLRSLLRGENLWHQWLTLEDGERVWVRSAATVFASLRRRLSLVKP